jgi:hypothetical protein
MTSKELGLSTPTSLPTGTQSLLQPPSTTSSACVSFNREFVEVRNCLRDCQQRICWRSVAQVAIERDKVWLSGKTLELAFTSLPRAQDTGGESPYIDPEDVLGLLIVGDPAVRLLITLRAHSAW